MKLHTASTADMVEALRHLMGSDDYGADFKMPSLLREVPSYSTTDSDPRRAIIGYGELGGSPSRDR